MNPNQIYKSAVLFEYLANRFYYLTKNSNMPSAGMLFFCPDDNTVLLTQRSKEMSSPNTWTLPGGRHSNEDNTPLETAERETKEEIHSLPKKDKLVGKYVAHTKKDHKYICYIYAITLTEKTEWMPHVQLDFENKTYKWFKYDELPSKQHFDLNWITPKIEEIIKNSK